VSEEESMTSNRPYLVRALYDWIVDNELTPHILVDAEFPHVRVPPHTVRQGKVVLNVGPNAVRDLMLDNEQITFSARFGGQPFMVFVPVAAVQAIYARENGQGMMFAPESPDDTHPDDDPDHSPDHSEDEQGEEKRSHLRVIK